MSNIVKQTSSTMTDEKNFVKTFFVSTHTMTLIRTHYTHYSSIARDIVYRRFLIIYDNNAHRFSVSVAKRVICIYSYSPQHTAGSCQKCYLHTTRVFFQTTIQYPEYNMCYYIIQIISFYKVCRTPPPMHYRVFSCDTRHTCLQ